MAKTLLKNKSIPFAANSDEKVPEIFPVRITKVNHDFIFVGSSELFPRQYYGITN